MALRRKRLKVAVACLPCRRKKVKCDGSTPVCSCCRESGLAGECSYAKRHNADGPVRRREGVFESVDGSRFSTGDLSVGPNEFHDPPVESQGADAMNGVTGDPAETREVFGNSSAGAFMRQLQAAADSRLDPSQSITPQPEFRSRKHSFDWDDPRSGQARSSLSRPSLLLPPRGLADALMRAYWDYNWALYPVINRNQVELAYESLWISESSTSLSEGSMSIINTCLAIGCHYCNVLQPQERRAAGDDFFSRAERSSQRIAGFPSIENVQCLLLFGIYLQSTSRVFQCWMVVGQGIRMAQSIGIHLQCASDSGSVAQREYRRRTWHGCVWLNCVLSATFGRPGMIQKWLFHSTPLPSMIDDEFFDAQEQGSEIRPDGRPCTIAFTVKAIELYQILDDLLVYLYLTPPRNEQQETRLTHILELDGRIQRWRSSLPQHLRNQSAPGGDAVLQRQAIVLRIRFLHVRVLLFRPTVVSYCLRRGDKSYAEKLQSSNNSSISDVMLYECARMCFRSAHELIDTFSRHLNSEDVTGPLPNWWYSVLYIYTATTIVLMERFLETRDGSTKESTSEQTWHNALRILECYSLVAEQPKRCIAALEILYQKFFVGNANNNSNHPLGENKVAQNLDSDPISTGQHLDISEEDLFSSWLDDSIWMNPVPGISNYMAGPPTF
ncbi:fungal-specific transcription factor domain-containing protein [Aspergillus novoparasiticus]|uniref:Fungal-specific transcription factor domain-containing protein n=1 Tax=Aspergillus novoparasiticus TaxID=986946 RepID=A0A5N6F798_9EURO|nr:fungal-specific transcription factor domain-containing protein [Aspergillus novoparasiticus]